MLDRMVNEHNRGPPMLDKIEKKAKNVKRAKTEFTGNPYGINLKIPPYLPP